eukprot:COSAG02_NODE_59_length_43585_cov_39.087752_15_plen_956_part_00
MSAMEDQEAAQCARLQRDSSSAAHDVGGQPVAAAAMVQQPNEADGEAAQWERLQAFLSRTSPVPPPLKSSTKFRCLHSPAVHNEEYEHFESVPAQASDGVFYLNARTRAEVEACAHEEQTDAAAGVDGVASAAGAAGVSKGASKRCLQSVEAALRQKPQLQRFQMQQRLQMQLSPQQQQQQAHRKRQFQQQQQQQQQQGQTGGMDPMLAGAFYGPLPGAGLPGRVRDRETTTNSNPMESLFESQLLAPTKMDRVLDTTQHQQIIWIHKAPTGYGLMIDEHRTIKGVAGAAAKAGVQTGSRVTAIGGKPVFSKPDVFEVLRLFGSEGQAIAFTVEVPSWQQQQQQQLHATLVKIEHSAAEPPQHPQLMWPQPAMKKQRLSSSDFDSTVGSYTKFPVSQLQQERRLRQAAEQQVVVERQLREAAERVNTQLLRLLQPEVFGLDDDGHKDGCSDDNDNQPSLKRHQSNVTEVLADQPEQHEGQVQATVVAAPASNDTCTRPKRALGGAKIKKGRAACHALVQARNNKTLSEKYRWSMHHVCVKGTVEMSAQQFATVGEYILGKIGQDNQQWQDQIGRNTTQVFFIAADLVVSTAIFTESNSGAMVVHLFATCTEHRRHGHGRQLLQLLESHATKKKQVLYVEYNPDSTNGSKEFWSASGYTDPSTATNAKVNSTSGDGLRRFPRWFPRTPVFRKKACKQCGIYLEENKSDEEETVADLRQKVVGTAQVATELQVGEAVDIVDNGVHSAHVIAVDVDALRVKVHFNGWNARHDSWYPANRAIIKQPVPRRTSRKVQKTQSYVSPEAAGKVLPYGRLVPKKTWSKQEEADLIRMVEQKGFGDWRIKAQLLNTGRVPGEVRAKANLIRAEKKKEHAHRLLPVGTLVEALYNHFEPHKHAAWYRAEIKRVDERRMTYDIDWEDGDEYFRTQPTKNVRPLPWGTLPNGDKPTSQQASANLEQQ